VVGTRSPAFRRKALKSPQWLAAASAISVLAAPLAGCGSAPTAPTEDAVITIGPTGVSPAEVRIPTWGRVKFVNSDTLPHTMVSDPIDTHNQCPPVNQVGLLAPGESRTTGTLNLARTCGFHDHTNQSSPSLQGRIIVE
jgi:plastocyanin